MSAVERVFAEPQGTRVTAPWLRARQDLALKKLQESGVPHRRVEAWKYSDLRAVLEAANDVELPGIAWSISRLPDGVEQFDLANLPEAPDWVRAHLGKSAAASTMPAASLAFAGSGFALRVSRRTVEPLRIVLSGSGHLRALIVLEADTALTIVETPAAGSFSNVGIEAVVGPRAQLVLVRIAEQSPSAVQIEDIAVRVARDASFRAHVVNGGALLSRLDLRLTLKEEGANAYLSGASVLAGSLHADVTTEIYHASGKTRSEQLFKKAVGGRGRAVYQGKITVAEGANGSDSKQTAKAILLSDRAEADLKPELEILADDVKCAHGAAIGDLDADSLFYLRSRGVGESEARGLLIKAFLEDAIASIEDDGLRAEALGRVESDLVQAMEPAL
jgi:Fe-S cluster assembly protein SufD